MTRKKTKYDLIDEAILGYQTFNQTSYVPTDELFNIFASYLDVPDNETLRDRYISTKISQYLGRKKDKDNRRIYLSTNTGGFSNIETERNVNRLNEVLEQLNMRNAGLEKSINKVKARKFFIENQISIDDLMDKQG